MFGWKIKWLDKDHAWQTETGSYWTETEACIEKGKSLIGIIGAGGNVMRIDNYITERTVKMEAAHSQKRGL